MPWRRELGVVAAGESRFKDRTTGFEPQSWPVSLFARCVPHSPRQPTAYYTPWVPQVLTDLSIFVASSIVETHCVVENGIVASEESRWGEYDEPQ